MKILFIADNPDTFKIHKDSTFAMMCAAQERQYQIYHTFAQELFVENSVVQTTARELSLYPKETKWYEAQGAEILALTAFDAVIMRTDPPFDQQYLYSTYLLTLAEKQGACVLNSGQAIRDFNEKLAILNFPQFTVPMLVTTRHEQVLNFLKQHHDIIVKPLDGMGGSGIFRLQQQDVNTGSILEMLMQRDQRTIMVQRYIPEIKNGDHRILIIDGQVVPYTLARIPKEGETRGNLAAGGSGVARPITDRQSEIATTLAPILKDKGIFLAGLDIIGDYLTEINVTSPTCFQEITQQTGFNVAACFMDTLTQKVSEK